MKKVMMIAVILSSFLILPNAFATDTQYTIQDIWEQYPNDINYPSFSEAYGINDSGYVVGRLAIVSGPVEKPFLWHGGSFFTIPGAGTTLGGHATDINNSNQFVGWASLPYADNPFITSGGGAPYREQRGFFVDSDQAVTVIHDFGPNSIDAAGNAYGSIPVTPYGYPENATWKAGSFVTPSTNPEPDSHEQAGLLTNLKDKLAPGYDPFWTGELIPQDINSVGQIVGYGAYKYDDFTSFNRAFIMTPVVTPEPASMLLFGLGGAALAMKKRKKRSMK